MIEGPPPERRPDLPFEGALLRWALLCVPIVYLVQPLGVLIHEILGHGLTARLYGGWFRGFVTDPWGGGYALCDAPGFELQIALAGAAAEAVAGLMALLAARRVSPGGAPRVSLLLVSAALLESACFIVVLGGFPGFEGSDFRQVADLLGDPGLGPGFAVAGGAGFLAVVCAFGVMLLREADATFGPAVASRGWRRAAVVLLLVLLPGLRWLLLRVSIALDPLQAIYRSPDPWPMFAAVAVHAVVAVVLFSIPRRGGSVAPSGPPGWRPLAGAWCLAIALFACARFWWNDGG